MAMLTLNRRSNGQSYTFTTFAGSPGVQGSADGTGAGALFWGPAGLVTDAAGNIYVADYRNHTIRKITPNGAVTTLAGLAGNLGTADGVGSAARFFSPIGVALDSSGNVLVVDFQNDAIRKIAAGNVVSTFAGVAGQFGSIDGVGNAARFTAPVGIVADPSGIFYVADSGNETIRKMTADAVVTTFAGAAGAWGTADGTGNQARFDAPGGLTMDPLGNIYLADRYNHTIRKITPAGAVSTVAGAASSSGNADGTGSAARFYCPSGVAYYEPYIYIADTDNHTIRRMTVDGAVTTIGGLAGSPGSSDGTGSVARFNHPFGVAVDKAGMLYIGDIDNNTVRRAALFSTFYIACPSDMVVTVAPGQGPPVVNFPPPAASAGATVTCSPPSGSAFPQGSNVVTCVATSGTNSASCRFNVNVLTPPFSGYTFTTLAGPSGEGVQFNVPFGVAVDSATNLYVTDSHNFVVRKISRNGAASVLAGVVGASGASDGTGSAARFNDPHEIAIDASGNLYVADTQNDAIRKITPAGAVSTLAGLAGVPGIADGAGAGARFNGPEGIAVDGSGNIYVCDTGNNTVRKITSAGVVTTLAGLAGTGGSSDGTGSAARFDLLAGLVMDSSGTLLVSDSRNCTIRKITSDGVVTTWVGAAGAVGSVDGAGSAARFNYPSGIKIDSSGIVYVADGLNSTIRKITPAGVVTTLAGVAGSTGSTDGQGSLARFNNPRGVALDSSGGIFVADALGEAIRHVTPDGVVSTVIGSASGSSGSNDGIGTSARFSGPEGIAVDNSGNVFVSDTGNNTIRKITSSGIVTTIAGLAGVSGSANGAGAAARFDLLAGLAVDSLGIIYVADSRNCTIRKVGPGNLVSTWVGVAGVQGSADGAGSAARFNYPSGVKVDGAGYVYVADGFNHTIRKITSGGVVSTLAGLAGVTGSADGLGSAARFNNPRGIVLDDTGNIYVADALGETIRKVTAAGQVSTLAGAAGAPGSSEGVGGNARFNVPFGVALDSANNLLVADSHNYTLRAINPLAAVTTIAGLAGVAGNQNGPADLARFNDPHEIAIDASGNIYIADTQNNSIRKGFRPGLFINCPADVTVIVPAGPSSVPVTYAPPSASPEATVDCSPPSGASFFEGTNPVVCTAVAGTNSLNCSFNVSVLFSPALFSQPQNLEVTVGQTFSLSVNGGGTAPLSYTWLFEGVPISGAADPTLIVTNAQFSNDGIYQTVVTNSVGSVTSSIARVRVFPPAPPVITADPVSFAVPEGSNAVFGVSVSGSPPLSFQWTKDGVALTGATAQQLTIEDVHVADAGMYSVNVSNQFGQATSSAAKLKIIDGPPFFAVQPASTTVTNGTTVTLQALARGTLPLHYQWRKDGASISSATNTSLTLPNTALHDAGGYDVTVFNSVGSATSAVAQVTIYQAPLLQSGLSNQIVNAGAVVTLTAAATGAPGFTYLWRFNDRPLAGATGSSLVLNNIQVSQSGYYQVSISNLLGSASSTGRVSVFGPRATIAAWGDNSGGQIDVPQKLGNVVAVAGGDFHSIALKRDGSLSAWGYNGDGQASLPTNQVRFVSVAAGSSHNLAITDSGDVSAWGRNESGQTTVPPAVSSVLAICAGDGHSVALLSSGNVIAWGNNSFGQGAVPQEVNGIKAIAAGRNHNLALRTNGVVIGWGLNDFGQASPPQSLSGVAGITAGYLHSAALLSNGTIVVWGDNSFGQTNLSTGLSNVVAIAAGDFHTIALKADSSVIAWGDDTYGQIDVPGFVSKAVGIGSGYYHAFALIPGLRLRYEPTAAGLVLTWEDPAILQWSLTPDGPYQDVPTTSNVYTNSEAGGPARFFRLRR